MPVMAQLKDQGGPFGAETRKILRRSEAVGLERPRHGTHRLRFFRRQTGYCQQPNPRRIGLRDRLPQRPLTNLSRSLALREGGPMRGKFGPKRAALPPRSHLYSRQPCDPEERCDNDRRNAHDFIECDD